MGSVVSQVFLEVTAVMTEKGLATLRKGHSFCVVVLGVLPPERRQCSGRMAPEVWRRSTRRLSLDVFFCNNQYRIKEEVPQREESWQWLPFLHSIMSLFRGCVVQSSRSKLFDRSFWSILFFENFQEKNNEHYANSWYTIVGLEKNVVVFISKGRTHMKSIKQSPRRPLWSVVIPLSVMVGSVRSEATQTGSEDLKSIFESHLVEAGRMLVLLETIESESYWFHWFLNIKSLSQMANVEVRCVVWCGVQQSCATLCDGNFVIFVQGRASVPVATWPCQHARRLNSYCRASHTGDAVRVGTLARCQETTLFAMLFLHLRGLHLRG